MSYVKQKKKVKYKKTEPQKKDGAGRLSGINYVIMSIVTFAMIFSSFGWVLSSGSSVAVWVTVAIAVAVLSAVGIVWYRRSREVS